MSAEAAVAAPDGSDGMAVSRRPRFGAAASAPSADADSIGDTQIASGEATTDGDRPNPPGPGPGRQGVNARRGPAAAFDRTVVRYSLG